MTREEAIEFGEMWLEINEDSKNSNTYKFFQKAIKAIEQEPKTWSLDDAREDFMSDVYDTLDFLPTNNECNKIIDSFDRVTSGIKKESKTGYWILTDEQNKEDVENDNYRFICSECQCSDIHAKDIIVPYCWKCGAEMESEE